MKQHRSMENPSRRIASIFQKLSQSTENMARSNTFPARLFRGEISLTLTFWIFSLSIPLTGHMAFSTLAYPRMDIQGTGGTTVLAIYAALVLLYSSFISISLYRSAERYHGAHGAKASAAARAYAWGLFVFSLLYTAYLYGVWSMYAAA